MWTQFKTMRGKMEYIIESSMEISGGVPRYADIRKLDWGNAKKSAIKRTYYDILATIKKVDEAITHEKRINRNDAIVTLLVGIFIGIMIFKLFIQ